MQRHEFMAHDISLRCLSALINGGNTVKVHLVDVGLHFKSISDYYKNIKGHYLKWSIFQIKMTATANHVTVFCAHKPIER